MPQSTMAATPHTAQTKQRTTGMKDNRARTKRYEARQSPALIQHHPLDQCERRTRPTARGLASVALPIVVLAVFWASLAWLAWGWLGAAIAVLVVLVVAIFTLGLGRSASEIETPRAAPRPTRLSQAA
jgi:hypothetical protein